MFFVSEKLVESWLTCNPCLFVKIYFWEWVCAIKEHDKGICKYVFVSVYVIPAIFYLIMADRFLGNAPMTSANGWNDSQGPTGEGITYEIGQFSHQANDNEVFSNIKGGKRAPKCSGRRIEVPLKEKAVERKADPEKSGVTNFWAGRNLSKIRVHQAINHVVRAIRVLPSKLQKDGKEEPENYSFDNNAVNTVCRCP